MIKITYLPCISLSEVPEDERNEVLKNHPYFQALGMTDEVIDIEGGNLPLFGSWVRKNIDENTTKVVII